MTRAVYERAHAVLQAGIADGEIKLGDWYGSDDAARRAWLMLRLMCGLIKPTVPDGGVRLWGPETTKKHTSRQKTYLGRPNVGCVNKSPFAACGAFSSGNLFVHTHSLASDSFMVESEEDIDASLQTTDVMLDKYDNPVETSKISRRLNEAITDQTELDPVQVNMFDFAELTKEGLEAATGVCKYRAHPHASQIVADAGGHEAIKELLRNPLVGDVVFVGDAARVEFKNTISLEMDDLRIIWFGHSTARLAFPKMGMHAFSWTQPKTKAFGIMFCETTGVWRNFMCVHGFGTLNGYTATSQGEAGMANNMHILVRIGDFFRFMHMQPICENFKDSPIFKRHVEELYKLAVAAENDMRRCDDENKPYVSRPLLMSKKGGKKGAETQRGQSATGAYAGTPLSKGGKVENRLQEKGKEMAETQRGQSATGAYAGTPMSKGGKVENRLQEKGKKLGDEYGKTGAEKLRAQSATGAYAGTPLSKGGKVENQLQEKCKELAETLRGRSATGAYAGTPMSKGGKVENRLQEKGKKLGDVSGYRSRTTPWVSVRATRTLNDKDDEFAVFDGSFFAKRIYGVESASVIIQKKSNKQNYTEMLNKYHDEDKRKLKNPVDLPASNLTLAFDTDTKLEDIVKSLEKCSRDKPVPVFRRGKHGKVLEADQATNWKFEVIEYLHAEARIAEMAAAAEAAKIVHRD